MEHCQALVAESVNIDLSETELKRAKQTLAAQLAIAEDDHMSLLQRLARSYFYRRSLPDIDALLAELEQTRRANVRGVIDAAWQQRLILIAETSAGF